MNVIAQLGFELTHYKVAIHLPQGIPNRFGDGKEIRNEEELIIPVDNNIS